MYTMSASRTERERGEQGGKPHLGKVFRERTERVGVESTGRKSELGSLVGESFDDVRVAVTLVDSAVFRKERARLIDEYFFAKAEGRTRNSSSRVSTQAINVLVSLSFKTRRIAVSIFRQIR